MRCCCLFVLLVACGGADADMAGDTDAPAVAPTLPAADLRCAVHWYWVDAPVAENWAGPYDVPFSEVDGGYALTFPSRSGGDRSCTAEIAWDDGWTLLQPTDCDSPCDAGGTLTVDDVRGSSEGDVLRLVLSASGACEARADLICDARATPAPTDLDGTWTCTRDSYRSTGAAETSELGASATATSTEDPRAFQFDACAIALDTNVVATMQETPLCTQLVGEAGIRVSDAAVVRIGEHLVAHLQYTASEGGNAVALGSHTLVCE